MVRFGMLTVPILCCLCYDYQKAALELYGRVDSKEAVEALVSLDSDVMTVATEMEARMPRESFLKIYDTQDPNKIRGSRYRSKLKLFVIGMVLAGESTCFLFQVGYSAIRQHCYHDLYKVTTLHTLLSLSTPCKLNYSLVSIMALMFFTSSRLLCRHERARANPPN